MTLQLQLVFGLLILLGGAVQPKLAQEIPELDQKTFKDVLAWKAPYELEKNCAYFLSGFDDEGAPVWVIEYGHWDVRTILEKGPEANAEFDKYTLQMLLRIWESVGNYSTPQNPVEEFILIDDLEGYNNRQFTHLPSVAKVLYIFRQFIAVENILGRKMKAGFGINLNFLATTVWGLSRPVLGDLTERIDVYGTNDEKWKPVLARAVPKHALPSWMGGYSNHTAVHVYG